MIRVNCPPTVRPGRSGAPLVATTEVVAAVRVCKTARGRLGNLGRVRGGR